MRVLNIDGINMDLVGIMLLIVVGVCILVLLVCCIGVVKGSHGQGLMLRGLALLTICGHLMISTYHMIIHTREFLLAQQSLHFRTSQFISVTSSYRGIRLDVGEKPYLVGASCTLGRPSQFILVTSSGVHIPGNDFMLARNPAW